MPFNVPFRFTSTSRSHSFSVYVCSGLRLPMPALLKIEVSPPSALAASSTAAADRVGVGDVDDDRRRRRSRSRRRQRRRRRDRAPRPALLPRPCAGRRPRRCREAAAGDDDPFAVEQSHRVCSSVAQVASTPPSTAMAWPVTNDAASEHSHTIGRGDLLGRAEPADGLHLAHALQRGLVAADEAFEHRRADVARAHRVDPDALLGVLEGHALGEADHAVLAGHVGRQVGEAHQARRPRRR